MSGNVYKYYFDDLYYKRSSYINNIMDMYMFQLLAKMGKIEIEDYMYF